MGGTKIITSASIVALTAGLGMVGAAHAQPATAQASSAVSVYPAGYFAPYKPDTAYDMVSRLPGFQFDGGAVQRGFAGSEGNVRIDGQLPASRSDTMASVLRRLPASSVERIELVSGGAPGIDMQGKTLVANVVRRKGGGRKTTATLGAALYGDGRNTPILQLETQRRTGERQTEGSIYYNESLDGGVGPRVRVRPTSTVLTPWDAVARYVNTGASGSLETPWASGRLRINGAFAANPSASAQRDLGPTPSAEIIARERYSGEAGLRYSRDLSGGANLQVFAIQQLSSSDLDDAFDQGPTHTRFGVSRQLGESILRGVVRGPKVGGLSVEGGLEADFNWLDSDTAYSIGGVPVVLPAAKVHVQETRGEAYVTANWAISNTVSLVSGLRYELSDIASDGGVVLEKSLSYLKPRVVLTWTPDKQNLVVLRAERVVDQLSFDDFSATASLTNGTLVAGNPNLEPQDAMVYEARYERRFGARGAVMVQYVHRDIDKVVARNIFVTPLGAYEASDNVGRAERDGVAVTLALPLDDLGVPGGLLRAGYTRRWSRLTDPITGKPRPLSGEAPYDIDLHFSQDLPARRIRWGADAYKTALAYAYLPSEIDTADGQPLVSAFFEYRPKPTVTWRLEGLNLLDRNYATTREVYNRPRDVGAVVLRERRDLRRSLGGAGVQVTLRKAL